MRTVRLTVFAIFSYLLVLQAGICALGLRQGSRGIADFRHLYTSGYMVRTGQGHDLYNYDRELHWQDALVGPGPAIPFDHLAYEALLFVPFSLLKYSTAYFVFAGLNALLLGIAARLFRPYLVSLEPLGKWVPEAIFVCLVPVAITIVLGQDSILLLALSVGAFIWMKKGRDLKAGLLLSLGFFKFQLLLPIGLLFLLWKRWRFVSGLAIGVAALAGISVWIAGVSGTMAFARTLQEMSVGLVSEAQKWKFGTYPISMPNLRGFIDSAAGSHMPRVAIQLTVLICSLLVVLVASRMQASLPLALLVAILVSYHSFIHDSSLLVLPLGMVLARAVSDGNLLLGVFDLLVFAAPAVIFEFFHSRYFPMALLLVALFLVWIVLHPRKARNSGLREALDSGSDARKLLA